MPCNSDYMNPTTKEIEMTRVFMLIDEMNGGGPPNSKEYHIGNDDRVYDKGLSDEVCDKAVAHLCTMLTMEEDVSQYSLEMQIWWRDHQRADKLRKSREAVEAISNAKKAALSKLTPEERKLLGL